MDTPKDSPNAGSPSTNAPPEVSSRALRMMELMGYKSGSGLGKDEQGVARPIEVTAQLGVRGLGLKISGLEATQEGWDLSQEDVQVEEPVEWLQSCDSDFNFTFEDMLNWPREDKPLSTVENDTNFCDGEILRATLDAKNIFNELGEKELEQARKRANPFETIKSLFFVNRASLKMVNIDAATGFLFTEIDNDPNFKGQDRDGPFYFADVCAGPGGFTEYVLWRKGWLLKGFGFTLKNERDFRLSEGNFCTSSLTFQPLYGLRGDGDVCCPENIADFKEKVVHDSGGKGVHFMMSDGGFSVEGNENMQEVLSKNIYIAQCLVALEILRPHGHFVTKVFDVFTCFSVGLLFLMYQCFEKVCILKPNSSRPANSERYFICKNLKDTKRVQDIRRYLRILVDRLWELKDDHARDIIEIVPLNVIKKDQKFDTYVFNSNMRLAKSQKIALEKLAAFCRNPALIEPRQDDLRTKCLKYWQIPDKPKQQLPKMTHDDLLRDIFKQPASSPGPPEDLMVQPRKITVRTPDLDEILRESREWCYVPMQGTTRKVSSNIYVGVGQSKTFRLQSGDQWKAVNRALLARGTLLYGELVKEYCVLSENMIDQEREEEKQEPRYKYSLQVIDALRLGDVDLLGASFKERQKQIRIYCEAINHEFRPGPNWIRIRPKFHDSLESLTMRSCLNKSENDMQYTLDLPVKGYKVQKEYFNVNSVLLLKTSKDEGFLSTYASRMQLDMYTCTDEQGQETHPNFEDFVEFLEKRRSC